MKSIFENIYEYENKVREMIFSNQDLLKYLSYETTYEPMREPNVDDPYTIENINVFFKNNALDLTTTDVKTFLLNYTETKYIQNSVAFSRCFITFDILVHNDIENIVVNSQNRKRTRDITILIDKYMNGKSNELGIGSVMLEYEGSLALSNKDYVGRKLVYRLTDFSYNYMNKK